MLIARQDPASLQYTSQNSVQYILHQQGLIEAFCLVWQEKTCFKAGCSMVLPEQNIQLKLLIDD